MYPVNSGYAMKQGPCRAPLASQMQLNGGPQETQPQALHGEDIQPQRIDMPPSYEERLHDAAKPTGMT